MRKRFWLWLLWCGYGQAENVQLPDSISVIAVGDIMLGSDYPSPGTLPPNDANILAEVTPLLHTANLRVGNLEGTLFDHDSPPLKALLPRLGKQPKQCARPSLCYVFRMPARYGAYLQAAGFDFLSLANNHSNDFGHDGRIATMFNLHRYGIKYAGLDEVAEYDFLTRDGITYGFIAFAPNAGTLSIHDFARAARLIARMKTLADIVIVMFHGGGEGRRHQHIVRGNEYFYGENRGNVFAFARHAVDAGADAVFGQGPHVPRAVELYRKKFIAYSAGNFATYGSFSLAGVTAAAPLFKVVLNRKGEFLHGEIIAFKQSPGRLGPFPDPQRLAIQRIIDLSKRDFPAGNGLIISPEGIMSPVK